MYVCMYVYHELGVRWNDLTAHPPLIAAIQSLSQTLATHDHPHNNDNEDNNGNGNEDDEDDRQWRRYSLGLETVLQGMGAEMF